MICPETLEDCSMEECDVIVAMADTGTPDATITLKCGRSWLNAQSPCRECGLPAKFRELSLAICRNCRDAEHEEERDEADAED